MQILARITKRRAQNVRSGGSSCCDIVAYEAVQPVKFVPSFQGDILPPSSRCILSWRWKQYAFLEAVYSTTRLHGVTAHKTATRIHPALLWLPFFRPVYFNAPCQFKLFDPSFVSERVRIRFIISNVSAGNI